MKFKNYLDETGTVFEINFHKLSVFWNTATEKDIKEFKQLIKDNDPANLKLLVESVDE